MALQIKEEAGKIKRTDGQNPTEVHSWIVSDSTHSPVNEAAARTFAIRNIAIIAGGLLRNALSLDVMDTGETHWRAVMTYGIRELPKANMAVFSFSTKGGSGHITQSIQTIDSKAIPGRTPGDYETAIGVSDATVAGVDIIIPQMNFSVVTYIQRQLFTASYQRSLYWMTGTVNNGVFAGMEPGEVLFLGVAAEDSTIDSNNKRLVRASFDFAAEPNASGGANSLSPPVTIGNIDPIDKRGHDYLWTRFEDAIDTNSHMKVKRPLEAHVEQVYRYEDFGTLGLVII